MDNFEWDIFDENLDENIIGIQVDENPKKKIPNCKQKINCPDCGQKIIRKNLKRHINQFHQHLDNSMRQQNCKINTKQTDSEIVVECDTTVGATLSRPSAKILAKFQSLRLTDEHINTQTVLNVDEDTNGARLEISTNLLRLKNQESELKKNIERNLFNYKATEVRTAFFAEIKHGEADSYEIEQMIKRLQAINKLQIFENNSIIQKQIMLYTEFTIYRYHERYSRSSNDSF